MSIEAIRSEANAVAAALEAIPGDAPASTGGGSRQRKLPEELRARFVAVRAALFQRGVFDPVLVRFDTATAPQASNAELAEQLESVATSL